MANETKIIITAATAQAEGALRGLGNSVAGLGGKFAAITGIGGALSITAFAGFIKSSIDAADNLNDLAQKTGTSVEALAGLKFAADQNGTSLEAVANASKKLSTTLVDKPELFAKLGITAKDSTGALIQMADLFADMPDGVEKTALAVKLMGRSGEEMIPFLNQGSAALRGMVEEGQRLNPITAEMAAQADQFNDNLAALKTQASGLGITLTGDLLGPLTKITDSMREAAREGGLLNASLVGLAQAYNALFTDDLLSREEQIVKRLGVLRRFQEDQTRDSSSIWFNKELTNRDNEEMIRLQQELETLRQTRADRQKARAAEPPQQVPQTVKDILAGDGKMGKAGKTEKPQALKDYDQHINEFLRMQKEAQSEMTRAALEAQAVIFDIDPMARAGAEWDRLTDLVEQGLLTQEQAAQSYAKTFDETVDKTKEATDQMTVYAEQAGRNIQDAFSEFLFDPFKGGLSGMLDNFQIMLRRMAAEAIASNVLNSVGAWGKSGGGAGTFVGDILGSVFGGARAIGGPVAGGKSYLVGERGPEIFTPASSGNITPNDKIGKSVTVINNFTISTPTDRRTQEQIAAMAGASIQTAMMRGA